MLLADASADIGYNKCGVWFSYFVVFVRIEWDEA